MKTYLPILFLFLTACTAPRAYFPDRVNNPMLKEKGEGYITISAKLQVPSDFDDTANDGNITTFDFLSPQLDAAYALTDHVGLIASFRTQLRQYQSEPIPGGLLYSSIGGRFNGYRGDIGAGVFTTMGKKGLAELYGGFGIGQISRTGVDIPQFNYTAQYFRFFLQPAAGLHVREKFYVMWGMRLALQKYYHINSADPYMEYYITTKEFIVGTPEGDGLTELLFPLIEPFVNFQFGGERIKGSLQLGFGVSPVSSSSYNILAGGGHIDLGITVRNPQSFFTKRSKG